ncbi:MAG: endonuclease VIII [Gammaproteobacteria bacterium]|nr:endonuclease VIII [Gammaproteobacteria bacterium]
MPEGPEIRLAADRVAEVLVGERIQSLQLSVPALQRYESCLGGTMVRAVDAHGKAMLTRFDNDLTLYSHNQLYGRWYVGKPGVTPRTNRSLRVALHTARGSAWLYSASDIQVLDAEGLAVHPYLSRLGPDILDPTLCWRQVAERLLEPRFAGRSLAALYLDQTFLAGLGNYLRSEILYFAGLSHQRRPRELERTEIGRLARQTLSIARRSYQTRGVTNPPARVRARKAAGEARRGQYRFAVFDREGLPCDGCGTPIVRVEAGSRRVYFCPRCQG